MATRLERRALECPFFEEKTWVLERFRATKGICTETEYIRYQ